MADHTYTKLSISTKDDPADGTVLLGVDVDGAFVPFSRIPGNRFDKYVARAEAAKAEAKAAKSSPKSNG